MRSLRWPPESVTMRWSITSASTVRRLLLPEPGIEHEADQLPAVALEQLLLEDMQAGTARAAVHLGPDAVHAQLR